MNYQAAYTGSWALVVGIDAYFRCPPLSNACQDARSIAEALEQHAGFPAANIQLLLNEQATRANILSHYHGLHTRTGPDDRIIVFFAGHGHSITGNTKVQGFLVPVDADVADLSSLIRWQEFVEGAEIIPAKHMLFVMDACFSGLLMQRAIGGGDSRFVTDMLQRFSRQAITAGKSDQTVGDGSPGGNSTFTHHFLEGLRGAAADKGGVITATAAMNYAYRRVSQDARSSQTPHYGHLAGDGDMVLRLPAEGPIDATTSGSYLAEVVAEVPESISAEPPAGSTNTFIRSSGYDDATSPEFGRNVRTRKLVQTFWSDGKHSYAAATRFMAVAVCPAGRLSIPPRLTQVAQRLNEPEEEANQPPHWRVLVPREIRTTLDTVLLHKPNYTNQELWDQFLCLDASGNLEVAVADQVMHHWAGNRVQPPQEPPAPLPYWNYVMMVGMLWSSLELARRLYIELAYTAGVTIRVALVGTLQGRLAGTSRMPGLEGKYWLDPLSSEGGFREAFRKQICEDQNIGLSYHATQRELSGDGARRLVDDFAAKIALAFNYHEENLPCFNWGTREFPWRQFTDHWRS